MLRENKNDEESWIVSERERDRVTGRERWR
jgi:hypothetical protein